MFKISRKISRWSQLTQFTGDSYFQAMMGHGLVASDNSELIDKLAQRGFLVAPNPQFIDLVKSVDRAKFMPLYDSSQQLLNKPVLYPSSKNSMSTPQFHAQIISLLACNLGPGKKALEIGCGSGYLPAIMHALRCQYVCAIERNIALLEVARKNLHGNRNCHVNHTVPDGVRFDAVYVSPYFTSEENFGRFLSAGYFSDDCVMVAAYQESPAHVDQQLVCSRRNGNQWDVEKLFRVACEPLE